MSEVRPEAGLGLLPDLWGLIRPLPVLFTVEGHRSLSMNKR